MFRTKKGAEVMITVNTDTEDGLINVQVLLLINIIDNIVKGFILNFANMKLAGKQCLLIAFVFKMG